MCKRASGSLGRRRLGSLTTGIPARPPSRADIFRKTRPCVHKRAARSSTPQTGQFQTGIPGVGGLKVVRLSPRRPRPPFARSDPKSGPPVHPCQGRADGLPTAGGGSWRTGRERRAGYRSLGACSEGRGHGDASLAAGEGRPGVALCDGLDAAQRPTAGVGVGDAILASRPADAGHRVDSGRCTATGWHGTWQTNPPATCTRSA